MSSLKTICLDKKKEKIKPKSINEEELKSNFLTNYLDKPTTPVEIVSNDTDNRSFSVNECKQLA